MKERSDSIEYLNSGKKVSDKVVPIDSFQENGFVPTKIDLSPALEHGIGQVAVIVVPTLKA